MPLFGQLYWLTGNILIDRANRSRAAGTISQIVEKIKQLQGISMDVPGRNPFAWSRSMLPFKTGAFHAAIGAGVPVVPIVCSSTDHIKMNRWDNGVVIVEVMPPVSTDGFDQGRCSSRFRRRAASAMESQTGRAQCRG